ncbi:hypothetical protein [Saccharococcus thermophilus]|uniref:Uncharacterized protein n=1 Tax=Saccharococcus thermophilus TaxID=29396 RepID=A0A846MAK3_9BACL|nr:hypothetical protein [Saccharococcus thermophilus]NIK13978.1 hypothetical protein [Saccharococcus thermophilus]
MESVSVGTADGKEILDVELKPKDSWKRSNVKRQLKNYKKAGAWIIIRQVIKDILGHTLRVCPSLIVLGVKNMNQYEETVRNLVNTHISHPNKVKTKDFLFSFSE